MHLFKLQAEVADWANRNFGSDPDHRLHPLLGVIEEIGELAASMPISSTPLEMMSPEAACSEHLLQAQALLSGVAHAVLKSAQGIRGYSTSDLVRFQFLCSEVVFYLTDALDSYGIPHTYGATDPAEQQADREDALGDVLIYLADFCRRNTIDLDDAVRKTWNQVKQRDWVANAATGAVEGGQ